MSRRMYDVPIITEPGRFEQDEFQSNFEQAFNQDDDDQPTQNSANNHLLDPQRSIKRPRRSSLVLNTGQKVNNLDVLVNLDRVFIAQRIQRPDPVTHLERPRQYEIYGSRAERHVMSAMEFINTDCLAKWCGICRPFSMGVKLEDSPLETDVIQFVRPCGCGGSLCCIPAYRQSIKVYSPPGNLIGSVRQDWSLCVPKFGVYDGDGKLLFRIRGSALVCSALCPDLIDSDFQILSAEGVVVLGTIKRESYGVDEDKIFTQYQLDFPPQSDVKTKAILISAFVLINYVYCFF